MIYYLAVFSLYYFFLGFAFQDRIRNPNIFLVSAIIPLISLVVVRGDVGTDTANYLRIIVGIRETGEAVPGLEILFVYLVKGLLFFTDDPRLVLAIVALATTAILIHASLISERATLVFAFCVVPIFYLDMTMNGIRYGLAFAVAAYSISKFYRGQFFVSSVLQAVAVFLHMSSLLLFVIILFFSRPDKERRWLLVTTIILALLILLINFPQLTLGDSSSSLLDSSGSGQLRAKYLVYRKFNSPTILSGLAPFGLSLLTLFLCQFQKTGRRFFARHEFFIFLVFICVTFGVAKFSYAGLRLQFVVLFAIFLTLQYKPNCAAIQELKNVKSGLVLLGILSVLLFFRGAINTAARGESPFLPYRFNPDFAQLESRTLLPAILGSKD